MSTNLFETAARKKFRFPSVKGDLTLEQLWDLKVTSTAGHESNRVDLDTVAIAIDNQLAATSKSFVKKNATVAQSDLEAKLEIVKHIISVREAEEVERKAKADNAARTALLKEALATKQAQSLASMTEEEIKAELAKSAA